MGAFRFHRVAGALRSRVNWVASLILAAYSLSSVVARFLIPLVPFWWLGTVGWFRIAQREGKTV
jgi:hypothetical protein